jgi:hypothetical protein
MQLRTRVCVAMLGSFPTWSLHMEETSFLEKAGGKSQEERVAFSDGPHSFPHVKEEPLAGASAGDLAGRKSPAPRTQVIDSTRDFGRKKFSRENPPWRCSFSLL